MSWKPEVQVYGEEPFYQNGVTFETEQEALDSARDLASRWTLVRDYRAVEVNINEFPINYKRVNGRDVHIDEPDNLLDIP
jgi:hypothetical protein